MLWSGTNSLCNTKCREVQLVVRVRGARMVYPLCSGINDTCKDRMSLTQESFLTSSCIKATNIKCE